MNTETPVDEIEQAVSEGGAYNVIRKRLQQQGADLQNKATQLNKARADAFGQTEQSIIARVRARTENNCLPRDIARVGKRLLLFGYNVFIGLKKETQVSDVFNLYQLVENEEQFEVVPYNGTDNLLNAADFIKDFNELYQYYKQTRLLSLHVLHDRLLAVFQIGEKLSDIRVFRWQIDQDAINYIDNRGERDLAVIPRHDFEWTTCSRDDHVLGTHPHVNILDKVFVETINGDLTIKVENNTEDGLGIYREPVEEKHQSLADASIAYAELGGIIALKIQPYREEQIRYLLFNTLNQQVDRIDAIGQSCVQLPEDHGLVFPGGYYLQDGESKLFDNAPPDLQFNKMIRSPNGEDVLYQFYEPEAGVSALFSYNLIEKQLQNPIIAHGSCLFHDGLMLVFKSEDDEPSRNHPMQLWRTPFFHDDYARQPQENSFYNTIGNADLVKGISDSLSLARSINSAEASSAQYEAMINSCQRMLNSYHWLTETDAFSIAESIHQIATTAELVLDEFEKVSNIRKQADQTLLDAETRQQKILNDLHIDSWQQPEEFVEALSMLRQQIGHLTTIKSQRYIDVSKIEAFEQAIDQQLERVGQGAVQFLSQPNALLHYRQSIEQSLIDLDHTQSTLEIEPIVELLENMSLSLDLLNETLASLDVPDTQLRTQILQDLSELYGKLNQAKAETRHRRKQFRSKEAVSEFAAQFKLFSQSINSALEAVETPQQCDDHLSRLLTQLEELESRFADFDEFLDDIVHQREQLFETFQSRKQQLLDERQRRCQNIVQAGERILASIQRRCQNFNDNDELNTYMAADPMLTKLRQLIEQLENLEASVQADDLQAKLKAIQEQALRSLRDRKDIFEDGGSLIKLGKHRFSVNSQPLDLTLINRRDQLVWHLVGTDFYQAAEEPELQNLNEYWQQSLVSETKQVYRSEYLVAEILYHAQQGQSNLTLDTLYTALIDDNQLLELVRQYANPRFQEGYEKGIHDVDACAILKQLLSRRKTIGLLRYAPSQRAIALAFWSFAGIKENQKNYWRRLAKSAAMLQQSLHWPQAYNKLRQTLLAAMQDFLDEVPIIADLPLQAAEYLAYELARDELKFVQSPQSKALLESFWNHLSSIGHRGDFQNTLQLLNDQPEAQWHLTEAWLQGLQQKIDAEHTQRFVPETIIHILNDNQLKWHIGSDDLDVTIENMMGEHPLIQQRQLQFSIDEFEQRLNHHRQTVVPGFLQFQSLKQQLTDRNRQQLKLEALKAKPLTSFVRNQLINDVYLPLIGDNLAKQMGTAGENKRTDLMGLLLLISPPGYGKTTLMEYVANRLGLIFMKINCPSLGHQVQSLDPAQAPNATAKQELEKINLAFEMGNNVMLYLDDIQHTHPEFLQKYIALCDGSRRIEGVWNQESKTYDLRGKKFCVIMAGNPYTESGEVFKIPDMLANRADIYNLGDVLSGNDTVFAQSYLENSLTSNALLQPLATRASEDIYHFIALAEGEDLSENQLQHPYASAEISEIVALFKNMLRIRDVVLKVNLQYIASAAQDDNYRTEPPFKLQGSYRNMNKMAEKVTAIMNEQEIENLISDHYAGEAQTLTRGAEENLLKLQELRGLLTDEQHQRWQNIRQEYARRNRLGDENDPAQQIVNQLSIITDKLAILSESSPEGLMQMHRSLDELQQQIKQKDLNIEVINQPVPGVEDVMNRLAELFEVSFLPVFSAMEHKLKIEHDTWERVKALSNDIKAFKERDQSSGL